MAEDELHRLEVQKAYESDCLCFFSAGEFQPRLAAAVMVAVEAVKVVLNLKLRRPNHKQITQIEQIGYKRETPPEINRSNALLLNLEEEKKKQSLNNLQFKQFLCE